MSLASYRNKFLAQRLRNDTKEVQEEVMNSRQVAGDDDAANQPIWPDDDSIDENERERRKKAFQLKRYVN